MLSNSIKFTNDNGSITLIATEDEENDNLIKITVKDNGVGIT